MSDVKYPQVEVELDLEHEGGNAFFILGSVRRALRQHGVPNEVIDQYQDEACSGDYDDLLAVTRRWVVVLDD